jgi:ABA4-like protein
MSTTFTLVLVAAAPFWALMILAPNWRGTRSVTSTPWMALPPLVFWFVFAIPHFGELLPAVAKPTLDGWQDLAANPATMTMLWAQIIAWDLFIGRWMYLDSRQRNAHPLAMAALLVLAIVLSPIAVPLYLLLRPVLTRTPKTEPTDTAREAVPV